MRGKRAKALRKMVTGDPDLTGRMFLRLDRGEDGVERPRDHTQVHHPNSFKGQYRQAKKVKGERLKVKGSRCEG